MSFVTTLPGKFYDSAGLSRIVSFVSTFRFLAAAEDLVGPYQFRVYDLLVLPHSFPYGGMVRHLFPGSLFALQSLMFAS